MEALTGDTVSEGDDILLYFDSRRSFLTRASKGLLHTHRGYVDLGVVVGLPFGSRVETNVGNPAYILRPLINDYVRKFSRRTQVMYLKDLGFALLWMGVGPGKRVLEAGTGSGAATAVLAYLVRPTGRVYSYDVHGGSLEVARRNLRRCGLLDFVELRLGDVTERVLERGLDSALLDLPEPWEALPALREALRPGARVISFSPTVNQVEKTVSRMEEGGFLHAETLEVLVRRMRVKGGMTRPENIMVAHTGYLVLAARGA